MRRVPAVISLFLGLSLSPVSHAETASLAEPPPPGARVEDAPPAAATSERDAKNALYLELGGPGLLYSVNYDRAFGDFAGRIGIGYLSLSAGAETAEGGTEASASFLAVPISVSYL